MATRKGLKKVKVKVSGYTATRYKKKATAKKTTAKKKTTSRKRKTGAGKQAKLF